MRFFRSFIVALFFVLAVTSNLDAASSRRTATNENVSTYGVTCDGTCDYTEGELPNWEADTDIDLVTATQSEVLECYDDAASFDDCDFLDGATTDSSYFRIIRPASGQGHDGTQNNGVTFAGGGKIGNLFGTVEDYSQTQDLIFNFTYTSSTSDYAVYSIWGGTHAAVVGCIIHGLDSTIAGKRVIGFKASGAGVVGYFVNCLVNDTTQHADERNFAVILATGNFYNCSSVDGGFGFVSYSGTMNCINCLSHNSSDLDFFQGGTNTLNYCASEDATANDWDNGGSGNNQINQTFTFEGAADIHLAAGDSGAKDLGTDLSATGDYQFDDDIDGTTRSGTWDIGFDEYVAAGGSIVPLLMQYYHSEMN